LTVEETEASVGPSLRSFLSHLWFWRLGLISFKRFNVFGRLDQQFPNAIAFGFALISLTAEKI